MKPWFKMIGIVLAIAALVLGIYIFLHWDSVTILMGTEELGDKQQVIPEVVEITTDLREHGDADWPCWRGINGDAHSPVTGIIKDWSGGLHLRWDVDFLCQGEASATWAAPVVQGDRLIACGRDDDHDWVFCIHAAEGGLLWKGNYKAAADSGHGTGMRATPCIDGDRVYTFGRSGDLVCWNLMDGGIRWSKNVGEEGGEIPGWGHSTSPLVWGECVYVQGGGTARVLAYDKMTGRVKWKSGSGDAGYAGLVAATFDGSPAVLAFHGHGLAALSPDTGREMWNAVWETPYKVNATTPLVFGDQIFVTSGYKTGGELLQIRDTGPQVLWSNKVMASHHSDPYILDGFLYGYSGQSLQNKGLFKCVELASGIERWASKDVGWGTCVSVDGHLLCLDIKGNLFLVKPTPEKLIHVTTLPRALGEVKGPVWTPPIIANGKLYLRFKQRLVCYDLIRDLIPSQR